ncbi:MAG: RecX family transcriptional regulator [Lentimicrobium sp.]|nr:RecX family transcriptional regulator [Lentimicrobium sp.]
MKEFEKQLAKIRRWCAMQERCVVEVKIHSAGIGISADTTNKIIEKLTDEGFIDEERFAKLYAGGKFRNKKWGRERIIGELRARQISEDAIAEGLKEIDEEDYRKNIVDMVEHKIAVTDHSNIVLFKHRLSRPPIAKGYEYGLVYEIIDELIKNKGL